MYFKTIRAIDFPRLLMYTNRHPEDGNNCEPLHVRLSSVYDPLYF